jgi:cellulose synthase/poly-beta-1,6-N-acetylglucosamine synthase-like glycosyltransferase
MIDLLAALYYGAVILLSIYGLLGLFTLSIYLRLRNQPAPQPRPPRIWPSVTVQLPIYNERYVVEALIEAAVALDYPAGKLQIQVVDDSTDETTVKAARLVERYQAKGRQISLQHRRHRQGYKAGALGEALSEATGEYIVLFDADFLPPADFLQQTIPHLLAEPELAIVQARWGHSNAASSPLTAAQAIALDKHFAIEQLVRQRANYFPKFNGSASVLRRAAVDAVGGWHGDTVTEDLCLSTRLVLGGWRCRFLNELVAPAQLPVSIAAYKSQQARWAQGSLQAIRKYGWQILRAQQESWTGRIYALLSMSAYLTNVCVLIMLLLLLPLVLLDFRFSPNLIFLSIAGIGQPLLFALAQKELYPDWGRRLRHLPMLLLIALGLAPSNSRALWQGLGRASRPFVRTPKQRDGRRHEVDRYLAQRDTIIYLELGLAGYALTGVITCLAAHNYGPVFFFSACLAGLGYVAWLSLQEQWQERGLRARRRRRGTATSLSGRFPS